MNLKFYFAEWITTKKTKKKKRQNVYNNLKRKVIIQVDDVFENLWKLLDIVSYFMEILVHKQQMT